MHVERLTDILEQHDREPPSQVFLEIIEPCQHAVRMIGCLEALVQGGIVHRHAEGDQQLDDSPP